MIDDFRDIHRGETALIIGNGPSLDVTPIEQLGRKYKSFSANKIYDSLHHPAFLSDYYTCVDHMMLTDCIPYLIDHPEFSPVKFLPREFPLPGATLLNVMVGKPISKDAAEYVVMGGTVTIVNLQLAYFMGFTTALLVGVDHRYPKSGIGIPGSKFIGDGDDPAHFKARSGAYFSRGKIYNRPELAAMENITYPAVKSVWTSAERKIINITKDTALHVFEEQDLRKWL